MGYLLSILKIKREKEIEEREREEREREEKEREERERKERERKKKERERRKREREEREREQQIIYPFYNLADLLTRDFFNNVFDFLIFELL